MSLLPRPVAGASNPQNQSGLFFEDFKFITYLGSSTGIREVSADVLNFNDANRANRSLWRTGLRIRVSGRKATRLAYDLFTEARQADALQART